MQTCPKCRYVRQPNETAPTWQCPACGVAYAKVAAAAHSHESRNLVSRPANTSVIGRAPWGKWVVWVALVGGLVLGFQLVHKRHGGVSVVGDGWGGDLSTEQIRVLASSVKAGEVVMYSTTECTYCAQAKGWLHQYGFAFTECNMSVSRECEREFLSFGGNGTPYLLVRGRHMKDGFDSDQFLALLRSR